MIRGEVRCLDLRYTIPFSFFFLLFSIGILLIPFLCVFFFHSYYISELAKFSLPVAHYIRSCKYKVLSAVFAVLSCRLMILMRYSVQYVHLCFISSVGPGEAKSV